MEREVGGGIRMGNTCKPMADSFQCMTKSTAINKKNKTKNRTTITSSMEKAMATHSSTLAWKIPWTEEPGRLESMGSPRVGHK